MKSETGFDPDPRVTLANGEGRVRIRPVSCPARDGWTAVREDGMKALALVDAPDHVCCRYRIQAFAPALEEAGWSIAVEGLARNPTARAFQLRRAGRFDAVILQRKLLPGWQFHILRRAATRLLFDFDDAVQYRDSYDARGPLFPAAARPFRPHGATGRRRPGRERLPGHVCPTGGGGLPNGSTSCRRASRSNATSRRPFRATGRRPD